jgi:ribonuclease HI
MNEQSGNSGELREALNWYEYMAKQMQRATLQMDSQVMLRLMKELALDGGNRARRAIESMTANDQI